MARLPRYFVPGVAQHIIQRGNNRQACFHTPEDFTAYCAALARLNAECGVAIHAYVLMTNHVHILATPSAPSSIPKLMQRLGSRYVGHVNHRYGRSGALFEGRYRSTVVDTDVYLLRLMRYIELNPVRAGMVAAPDQYRWSSYGCNAAGRADSVVTAHPLYEALGLDLEERRVAYRALFNQELEPETLVQIREASHHGWALGNDRFRAEIERACDRRAAPMPKGGAMRSLSLPFNGVRPH
jgi:putative transposase